MMEPPFSWFVTVVLVFFKPGGFNSKSIKVIMGLPEAMRFPCLDQAIFLLFLRSVVVATYTVCPFFSNSRSKSESIFARQLRWRNFKKWLEKQLNQWAHWYHIWL